MEIPSSSPIYSPLKPETAMGYHDLGPADQVVLFPGHTEPNDGHRESNDHSIDSHMRDNNGIRKDSHSRSRRNSQREDNQRNESQRNHSQRKESQIYDSPISKDSQSRNRQSTGRNRINNGNGHTDHADHINDSIDDSIDLTKYSDTDQTHNSIDHNLSDSIDDAETTIFSDSEYEVVDTDSSQLDVPSKNTQNYLDALLTESLLESLPLPSDKKAGMRRLKEDSQI